MRLVVCAHSGYTILRAVPGYDCSIASAAIQMFNGGVVLHDSLAKAACEKMCFTCTCI